MLDAERLAEAITAGGGRLLKAGPVWHVGEGFGTWVIFNDAIGSTRIVKATELEGKAFEEVVEIVRRRLA